MELINKSSIYTLFKKANFLFVFIFILSLSVLIYPDIKILILNILENNSTSLAQSGENAVKEDVFLYFSSYKNLILGKNFFFDQGDLSFNNLPLPLPYISQIIGNIITFLVGGNDNISIIILRILPLISLILLYKIFLCINFTKNESIIFSFFTIISVYETSRFPSPSITYIFFLLSILLILKSLNDSKKKNILLPVILGLQTWVYFHNFVVVAPVYIYSILLRKTLYKTDIKVLIKEILIFSLIFLSYFIFTLSIRDSIQPSFFEKILWSADYAEWKDYNIHTTFGGRYKISILFILFSSITFIIFKLSKKLKFKDIFFNIKKSNYIYLQFFFIIFCLSTFFPILLEKFFNFPQPQVIFIRIGQFQILFLLCIFYKNIYSYIGHNYLNFYLNRKLKVLSLFIFFLLSLLFLFKNISFAEKETNHKDFIISNNEKKLIVFLKNDEKCIFASNNKKIQNLVNIGTKCRIVNVNIFNTNLKFSELIERYILVDIISGYNLRTTIERFNLNAKFLVEKEKICHYNLKENYKQFIKRNDHISQIFHHAKCNLGSLKEEVYLKYDLMTKDPQFYIDKYNLKYFYSSLPDSKISLKFFRKTSYENLMISKNYPL